MRNLERVLNEFNPVTMGAARTPKRPDLQKRLAALSARNAIYFRLGVGMVLVCYVGLFVVAWFHRADVATFVPLIFAAAGLTWWVVSLWREKACTDLILEFANDFPDQVLGVLVSTASRAVSANLRALSTAQELAKLGTPPPPPGEP